ncbi:NAD(P)-dependent oxidoreductase [Candidatus Parcubacteria bacterium]|nr:MAG: NAD(P)-dependent oxidoreductase [Candidatus Parcubacteria bacterium]
MLQNPNKSICVIFGGTGFIGSHFAKIILEEKIVDKVVLADLKPVDLKRFNYLLSQYMESGQIEFAQCDVRDVRSFDSIQLDDGEVSLVANFAAIHREPGYEPHEYFETNILGAENVCNWAERVGCKQIIFTSSIAPYGPSESPKTEESIPCPETAYGASKLVAEKIHLAWQKADLANRKLVIVRPGVVFGPGEGGNVTRLVRAVLGRYFFYMGNRRTVKAGIYVKELCYSMLWALKQLNIESNSGCLLYNASLNPSPSVEEYVNSICKVAGVTRSFLSVPYCILFSLAWLMEIVARPLGINHPFSPVRVRKLVRSNNIQAKTLSDHGYEYRFNLASALADWKRDMPRDWEA